MLDMVRAIALRARRRAARDADAPLSRGLAGLRPGIAFDDAALHLQHAGFEQGRLRGGGAFERGRERLRLYRRGDLLRRIEYELTDPMIDFEAFRAMVERAYGPPHHVTTAQFAPKFYWLDRPLAKGAPEPPYVELSRKLFASDAHSGLLAFEGGEPTRRPLAADIVLPAPPSLVF